MKKNTIEFAKFFFPAQNHFVVVNLLFPCDTEFSIYFSDSFLHLNEKTENDLNFFSSIHGTATCNMYVGMFFECSRRLFKITLINFRVRIEPLCVYTKKKIIWKSVHSRIPWLFFNVWTLEYRGYGAYLANVHWSRFQ